MTLKLESTFFQEAWGKEGYRETWCGYKSNRKDEIDELIKEQLTPESVVLEIGAGGGYWTENLIKWSNEVNVVDVIDKPDHINSVKWHKNNSLQFNCKAIESNSIDFVFTFGCFCHIDITDVRKYLKDINRVMKEGATGILMFPNADRLMQQRKCTPESITHSRMTLVQALYACRKAGFECSDMLPDFRDSLILIKKLHKTP